MFEDSHEGLSGTYTQEGRSAPHPVAATRRGWQTPPSPRWQHGQSYRQVRGHALRGRGDVHGGHHLSPERPAPEHSVIAYRRAGAGCLVAAAVVRRQLQAQAHGVRHHDERVLIYQSRCLLFLRVVIAI